MEALASLAPALADDAAATETTVFAAQVIAGLLALVALAYLAGHPRVVALQDRFGVGSVITAGFPYVALGLVASLPSVGILDDGVLDRVRPVLEFGLGWLGFLVGMQLDIRLLDRVPRGTAYLITAESLAPFAVTAAACAAVLIATGVSWRDPALWRDMIVLGAAAAMTAPRRFRGLGDAAWSDGRSADVLVAQLDELIGVIGLVFLTAFFRDPGADAWLLPGTGWLFVSLGIGVAIGVAIFAMIRVPGSNAEFLAIVLGGVAFASGFAVYMRLSPIATCFIAGVLVTNFPNEQRASVLRILQHLERPVHAAFLIVAGALWDVSDWRGWLLVPVFVAARIVGKWLGITASSAVVGGLLPPAFTQGRTLVAPLSVLSIALVLSVAGPGRPAWLLTAILGGALVNTLLVRWTEPRPEPPA